jgi:hypothetical protein
MCRHLSPPSSRAGNAGGKFATPAWDWSIISKFKPDPREALTGPPNMRTFLLVCYTPTRRKQEDGQ